MEWLLNRRRFMTRHAEEEWVDKGYLTFLAEETCVFTFKINAKLTTEQVTSVSYSLDNGKTWITTNNNGTSTQTITTPTVRAGKRIIWKGIATLYDTETYYASVSAFSSTGNFVAYGNVISMLIGDNFADESLLPTGWNLRNIFYGCTKLTDASGMVFPISITTNAYYAMFYQNTGLITPPSTLPATTLTDNCYRQMFFGCSNMTSCPAILATTVASMCCYQMFQNDSNITTSPVLLALSLAYYCYANMFLNCTKLNHVTMYATSGVSSGNVSSMLSNTSSTGTFVKNSAATWTESIVIPSNWTVETVVVNS